MTGKCHNLSTCIQAVLAMLKMFLSIVVLALGLVCGLVSIVLFNSCYFAGKSFNDKTWFNVLTRKGVPEEFYDICISQSSTGNLSKLLPASTNYLVDMTNMIEGFNINLSEVGVTDPATASPAVIAYKTNFLDKYLNWELQDYSSTKDDSPEKNMADLKELVSCTGNDFQVDHSRCASGSTQSTISHSETSHLTPAENYCIVFSDYFELLSTRYTTSGTCVVAADGNAAHEKYNFIKQSVDEHTTLLNDMITSIEEVGNKSKVVYQGLLDSKGDVDKMKNILEKTIAIIEDTKSGKWETTDCRILRLELRNIIGNFCYNFLLDFNAQGKLLLILGSLMVIMSICICCSYKLSSKQSSKKRSNPNRKYLEKRPNRKKKNRRPQQRRPINRRSMQRANRNQNHYY